MNVAPQFGSSGCAGALVRFRIPHSAFRIPHSALGAVAGTVSGEVEGDISESVAVRMGMGSAPSWYPERASLWRGSWMLRP